MDMLEAVKATYAVIGQEITDLGLVTIVMELRTYPEVEVMTALSRCRKECRRLTLADILDRLPSGHPPAEEAWAIAAPTLANEDVTVVITQEIATAMGACRTLANDPIAARMAFKEVYAAAVQEAKTVRRAPVWRVSLGHDVLGREAPVLEAVAKGRLAQIEAERLLPDLRPAHPTVTLPAMKELAHDL